MMDRGDNAHQDATIRNYDAQRRLDRMDEIIGRTPLHDWLPERLLPWKERLRVRAAKGMQLTGGKDHDQHDS